ncbi:unnamed protein product [Litomosoides sigmodontis]|uniref:Uncharacterized protein n=1 Tax=Litomosoides sigmodontis TaxID=42156 RepID=A0A3P6SEU9_LITSI|nr:unnamed protein product [Litomosoides sigmodontis]
MYQRVTARSQWSTYDHTYEMLKIGRGIRECVWYLAYMAKWGLVDDAGTGRLADLPLTQDALRICSSGVVRI